MYTLHVDKLIALDRLQPHQCLLANSLLTEYTEDVVEAATFVSHQWAGFQHPDPEGKQLAVLKKAILNLQQRRARVHSDDISVMLGFGKKYAPDEILKLLRSYVWLDYISVPQITGTMAAHVKREHFRQALDSFPAYVQLSRFFVVLAPAVQHTDLPNTMLSYSSWKTRGWCRVERAARAFADGETSMLLITNDSVIVSVGVQDYLFDQPGAGHFTVEADRLKVQHIMKDMVELKLAKLLLDQQLSDYRMLFSVQRSTVDTEEEAIMDCSGDSQSNDTVSAPEPGSTLSLTKFLQKHGHRKLALRFLRQLGLHRVSERDRSGRTAIHYASASGDGRLVSELLRLRADPATEICSPDPKHCLLAAGATPLHVATLFSNGADAVTALLRAGASSQKQDGLGRSSLAYCAFAGRPAVAERLLVVSARLSKGNKVVLESRDEFGATPLMQAALLGRLDLLEYLLERKADATAVNHWGGCALSLASYSGSIDVISPLVAAGCSVNAGLTANAQKGSARIRRLGVRCRAYGMCLHNKMISYFGAKGFAGFASNCREASPLILATVGGRWDVARMLMEHGADVNKTTVNGFTAADWAVYFQMPETVVQELRPEGPSDNLPCLLGTTQATSEHDKV